MKINITEAKIEHLDAVAGLFNKYMVFYEQPSNEEKYKAYLKERMKNNEATIYLASDDKGIPLGFVQNYHSFSSVSQGKIITLNDLYVASDYRKKGIGEKLINRTFELAKEIGALRVDLKTAHDNYEGQSLYEKIGFKKDEDYYSYSYDM